MATINVSKSNSTEPTAEERAAFRGRVVEIGTRGLAIDALHVDLPSNIHGEWVHDDAASIAEKQVLGYEVDTVHAAKSKQVHSDGTGKAKYSDVIFMTIPKWKQDIIQEERTKDLKQRHSGKVKKEEKEFLTSLPEGILAAPNRSTSESVNLAQIKSTINEGN